ncbi:MAG: hypothetical protein RI964_625 [Pseudomonadota bacterium]|jgi:hypothetical protein
MRVDDHTADDMPGDDPLFDVELQGLFRQALQHESFQQQVAHDLCTLSAAGQAGLTAQHQTFVQEENLSAAVKERLLDSLPCDCAASPVAAASSATTSWLSRLLQSASGSTKLGVGLMPFLVIAGVVGVVCVPLVLMIPAPPPDVVRGGAETNQPLSSGDNPSVQPNANGLTPAIRERQPQQWLAVIAHLLEQGNVTVALDEWRHFSFMHPTLMPASGGKAVSTPALRQQPQQWLAAMAAQVRTGDLQTFNAEFVQFRAEYPTYHAPAHSSPKVPPKSP